LFDCCVYPFDDRNHMGLVIELLTGKILINFFPAQCHVQCTFGAILIPGLISQEKRTHLVFVVFAELLFGNSLCHIIINQPQMYSKYFNVKTLFKYQMSKNQIFKTCEKCASIFASRFAVNLSILCSISGIFLLRNEQSILFFLLSFIRSL
jgi:hypothetical protein